MRLERTTPHTLRHSLAHSQLELGEDLAAVQRTLSHISIAATGMYFTPNDDDIRRAMEGMEWRARRSNTRSIDWYQTQNDSDRVKQTR